MRRAFTLIELLVVIAIIAILAAILFPVFAQAKTAAKKATAISGQKQISLGFLMYLDAYDDHYPRRRGCELNSSLNQDLNDNVTRCGGSNGFGHSMTWQSWQKYIMPFVKNLDIFFHPLRKKDEVEWKSNGEIKNSYVVNLGIMGASTSGFESISWTGGVQSNIPNTSAAMILMEMPNTYGVPFVVRKDSGGGDPYNEVVYNMAIREYWKAIFYTSTSNNNCKTSDELDPVGAGPHRGAVLGMADGHAKFITAPQFLARTPTNAEYLPGQPFPASGFSSNCRRSTSAYVYDGTPDRPKLDLPYPMWGLGG